LLQKEGCEIRMGNSLPCPFHVWIAAFLESFWHGRIFAAERKRDMFSQL
jgi:hypothetical protein